MKSDYGRWENGGGYTLVPTNPPQYVTLWPLWWRKRQLWEYTADHTNPPTFICRDGSQYRYDYHCITDNGSIPPIVTWLFGIDPMGFLPCYVWHDMLYQHGGCWKLVNGIWVFIPMTQDECDQMLREMLLASGCPPWQAQVVYEGLKMGGFIAWRGHAKRREQEEQKRKAA